MSKNLILVFTRNPELGKVKTRLAKTIGDESALKVYTFLLNHTEKIIRNFNCDKAVYYSVKVREQDMWDHSIYQKYQQNGNDLGIRMQNAFQHGFNNSYNKIVIVGSDLFDLKARHIEEAFEKLNTHDVVIGPAQDGGYYLLGMTSMHTEIFKNKKWGTASVFENTIQDLKNENVHLLDILNDIDTYDDMKNTNELMQLLS